MIPVQLPHLAVEACPCGGQVMVLGLGWHVVLREKGEGACKVVAADQTGHVRHGSFAQPVLVIDGQEHGLACHAVLGLRRSEVGKGTRKRGLLACGLLDFSSALAACTAGAVGLPRLTRQQRAPLLRATSSLHAYWLRLGHASLERRLEMGVKREVLSLSRSGSFVLDSGDVLVVNRDALCDIPLLQLRARRASRLALECPLARSPPHDSSEVRLLWPKSSVCF